MPVTEKSIDKLPMVRDQEMTGETVSFGAGLMDEASLNTICV